MGLFATFMIYLPITFDLIILSATLSLIQKNKNPSETFFISAQKSFETVDEKKIAPLTSIQNYFTFTWISSSREYSVQFEKSWNANH